MIGIGHQNKIQLATDFSTQIQILMKVYMYLIQLEVKHALLFTTLATSKLFL